MGQLLAEDDRTLYRIVYDSVVMLPFGDEGAAELQRLMEDARRRNALSGITGVLRYDGAYFMQVLEGPRGPTLATMARIQRDRRHSDVRVLEVAPLRQRDFGSWSMVLVTDTHVMRARERDPDILEVAPYRAAEVVHSLRAVLEAQGTDLPAETPMAGQRPPAD